MLNVDTFFCLLERRNENAPRLPEYLPEYLPVSVCTYITHKEEERPGGGQWDGQGREWGKRAVATPGVPLG